LFKVLFYFKLPHTFNDTLEQGSQTQCAPQPEDNIPAIELNY